MTDTIQIHDQQIAAGETRTVDLPVAQLYTDDPLTMPVRVVRGRRPGPTVFLSAAIHGDELNGVEIIRRVLRLPGLKTLRGTLLAVPVVNVHGFLRHSRYLPDRRDLNRSFPGSETGSVAARLAHLFLEEVVARSDVGIDLHTGAIHRPNFPQIRANLSHPQTESLARAFGAPLILDSPPVEGTLRDYTTQHDVPVLLYESGEALRFDETAIRIGVAGVRSVLRELGMLAASRAPKRKPGKSPYIAHSSGWVRASRSGVLRTLVPLGAWVKAGQRLAVVADPFGETETVLTASHAGVVIGRLCLPLVHEGDAVMHIARINGVRDGEALGGSVHDLDGLPIEPRIV
jgi:hypothetical protein